MHCTIFPVYRSILKGKSCKNAEKKNNKQKIEHNLIEKQKKKKKPKKNPTQQALPAMYLSNELISLDATLQRCEWIQTLHSHNRNDLFRSYSAKIFFVQNFFKYKC